MAYNIGAATNVSSGKRAGDQSKFRATKEQLMSEGMSESEAQALADEVTTRKYGGGMSDAELQDFETLVGRLEASKMRQAAQSNRARQRDTFAGGLASMMGNFWSNTWPGADERDRYFSWAKSLSPGCWRCVSLRKNKAGATKSHFFLKRRRCFWSG